MKTIVIDGIEYELKPVAKKRNILDDYNSLVIEDTPKLEVLGTVQEAVGVESTYRKKYVQKELTPNDLPSIKAKPTPKPQLDGFFLGEGSKYFEGEGIQTYY